MPNIPWYALQAGLNNHPFLYYPAIFAVVSFITALVLDLFGVSL